MVGTLIKTMAEEELFIGLIVNWWYDGDDEIISLGVTWNDCDETTETFREHEDYDSSIYHFYDNGRWWRIDQNYYKFKRLLEDK